MKKNIEQEKAIAQLEGPVILISCPGSGKTTTLLRRINHMLEVGIPFRQGASAQGKRTG